MCSHRDQYVGWLIDGNAMLLLATISGGPAGYAERPAVG
jgi:hypothetical protein